MDQPDENPDLSGDNGTTGSESPAPGDHDPSLGDPTAAFEDFEKPLGVADQVPPPPPPSGVFPPPPPPPPSDAFPPPPPFAGSTYPEPGIGGHTPGPGTVLSPTAAASYGWSGFRANLAPAIGLAIIALLVTGLANGIATSLRDSTNSVILGAAASILATLVSMVVGYFVIRAALMVLDGRRIESSGVLNTETLPVYLITAILVSIITNIGLILLIIPGLIAAFLLQFYGFAVVDKVASTPTEALKTSVDVVTKNVVPVLLLDLLLMLLMIIGALLCGVGLLAAMPVALIALGYAWRHFTNGRIAPLAA